MLMLPMEVKFLTCPNVRSMPHADMSGQIGDFTALVHAGVLALGGIGIAVPQYGIPLTRYREQIHTQANGVITRAVRPRLAVQVSNFKALGGGLPSKERTPY